MKKIVLLYLICIGFGNIINAATGDTTTLVAHTLTNLNSPPSNDDIWVTFPNTATTYQKIIMKFTLGCGTPNCSGWDYTVNASIGKKNGGLDSTIVSIDTIAQDTVWSFTDHVNFMEIGRLITPYGTYMAGNSNGFNNSWTHPYYYDVTDYASLLKDSVNVRVFYSGWSDAFSAKIEFVFIEGSPNREVENVREVYNTYIDYPNSTAFESVANAKTFAIAANVTSAKVVVNMTGHGNQGEFDPRYFHVLVNGSEIYNHILWKDDCDITAIAPQGGTWIFARANWCPGEKVPVYEVDISEFITPGQNVTIDLDLDDFAIQSGASAGYGLSTYLVTYTSQKQNDVMLEEIISPNNDKPYLHWNPVCTQPKVKIKNTGAKYLTYAQVAYWVQGGSKWYYEWNGNLAPYESEQITLPSFDWNGLDTNSRVFYAEATWPNQKPDEYTFNNKVSSSFAMVPKLDSVFVVFFKANNQPWENKYVLKNEAGDTISYKNTFVAGSTNLDTLHLEPGSYSFDFFDYDSANFGCGDGLRFFVNQPPNASVNDAWYETTGQLAFRKLSNPVIKNFNPDLGGNVHYEFTVGYPLGYNAPKAAPTEPSHPTSIAELSALNATIKVYPNPASKVLNIQLNTNQNISGIITITNIAGSIIQQLKVTDSKNYFVTIPSSEYAKGIYFINFTSPEIKLVKKVVVQ